MTRMKRLIAALIALPLATLPALAQDDLDANADGVLSYDELLVGYPTLSEEDFIIIDANADGLVDADELAAGQEAGLLVTES